MGKHQIAHKTRQTREYFAHFSGQKVLREMDQSGHLIELNLALEKNYYDD